MSEKKLLELKEKIDTAKSKVNKLEGQKEHLMGELKNEWGCNSVKDAKKKLSDLKEKSQSYQDKIDEGIEELEEIL